MPIALHINVLVPRANPLRMPVWPWPFRSRQVDTLRWLGRNDVWSTGVHIWRRVVGEWPRSRRLSKKLFRECCWFSNFSIFCGHCWWKLLVCSKTFINCEQLCNNAVNYPSIPLDRPTRYIIRTDLRFLQTLKKFQNVAKNMLLSIISRSVIFYNFLNNSIWASLSLFSESHVSDLTRDESMLRSSHNEHSVLHNASDPFLAHKSHVYPFILLD
jgi:hypothetical protein